MEIKDKEKERGNAKRRKLFCGIPCAVQWISKSSNNTHTARSINSLSLANCHLINYFRKVWEIFLILSLNDISWCDLLVSHTVRDDQRVYVLALFDHFSSSSCLYLSLLFLLPTSASPFLPVLVSFLI